MTDRADTIRKRGSEWVVLSLSGREMGTYSSEAEAKKRLAQIERFSERVGEIHSDPERTDGALATVDPDTGFLRVDARLTRTGVFPYADANGETWGELRTEDEVFDDGALDSFRLAVVTDDHPSAFVTSKTVRDVQIGSVGTDVRRDGDYVRATLLITDADAIEAIQGATYAARQTQIRGNHVAVVDRGRAGPECRILDTPGASRTTIGDQTMTEKTENPREETRAIKIGDEMIDVAARVAAEIESLRADSMMRSRVTVSEEEEEEDVKDTDSALRAKVDALQAQLEETRASESDRIDARVRLVTTARDILGTEAKTDGVSDADIMRATILAVSPSLAPRLDNNAGDVGYLRASFDAAVDLHRSRASAEADTMAALFATAEATKADAADPDALYADYLTRLKKGPN